MQKTSFSSIARELGVSTALVSNVMRNTSSTTLAGEATKQRILDAAWRKGLRLSNTIGIIVPGEVRRNEALFYPGFAGITERCAKLGFSSSLFIAGAGVNGIPDFLLERNACGIIFWNEAPDHMLRFAAEEKIPFVILNPQREYPDADTVSFNDYATMRELLEYLYRKSYRDYIFISGNGLRYIEEQKSAFRDFLKEKNVSGTLFDRLERNMAELKKMVSESNENTVFITFSRYESMKLLEYFARYSKTFPKDGGVVASNLLAEFYTPRLTAIVNPYYESGSRVVDMIAEKWKEHKLFLRERIVLLGAILKNPSTGGPE